MAGYQYTTNPLKIYNDYSEEIEPKKKNLNQKKPNTKVANRKKTVAYQEMKRKKELEKHAKTKEKIRYFVLFAMLLGCAFTIIYKSSYADEKIIEINRLKKQVEEIEKENSQLGFTLQTSSSLLKIENEAINKLGMSKIDNSRIKKVNIIKEDYIEPVEKGIVKEEEKTIFTKIYEWIMEII